MANKEHSTLILRGLNAWNDWRAKNPQIKPDLSGINFWQVFSSWVFFNPSINSSQLNLSEADLIGVDIRQPIGGLFLNLSKANLSNSNLSKANLTCATFKGATLINSRINEANLSGTDLEGADLSYAQLSATDISRTKLVNAKLISANLTDAILRNANLSNADLHSANFSNVDLRCVILRSANLSDTNLSSANLKYADLYQSIVNEKTNFDKKWDQIWKIINEDYQCLDLTNADLIGANLHDAKLSGVKLNNADMKGVNLKNADLSNANLSDADLSMDNETNHQGHRYLIPANLTEANLINANLSKATLSDARLTTANLQNANLNSANLNNSDLSSANLNNANLSNTNLQSARLCKATLIKSNLRNANIADAKLSNANLSNADLRGTNLSNTKLRSVNLKKAYFDKDTTFPQNFDPIEAGMIDLSIDYENPYLIEELLSDKKNKEYTNPPPRPGQDKFREKVSKAYNNKCAISGCDIEEILEAAHIIPWKGDHSHEVWNGLLLRVDLHKLFDSHLITIHPETIKIITHPTLEKSYPSLTNQSLRLRLPEDKSLHPKKDILKYHFDKSCKRGCINN